MLQIPVYLEQANIENTILQISRYFGVVSSYRLCKFQTDFERGKNVVIYVIVFLERTNGTTYYNYYIIECPGISNTKFVCKLNHIWPKFVNFGLTKVNKLFFISYTVDILYIKACGEKYSSFNQDSTQVSYFFG